MTRKPILLAACLAFGASSPLVAAPAKPQAPSAPDQAVLHVQVILDHLGFSPGVLDGKPGMSLTAALKGFQQSRGLGASGKLDKPTQAALQQYANMPATQTITLTPAILGGPFTNPLPKQPAEQAKLPQLGYRNAMEKMGEMFHTTPAVLVALNSGDTRLAPGVKITVPAVVATNRNYDPKLPEKWRQTLSTLNVDAQQPQAAKVVVDKSDSVLRAYDASGKLIAQFQATMGSKHDPLPIGTWKILGPAYNPPFHYNPKLFWDAKKGEKKATLPPGPNGPVGVVWLDLSKEHYGIHGTPEPTTIGRAESHGCIRLANWNAARLAMMVKPGTPAIFQE
ncbi:L,D-transpeptidase family protein [Sphingomonas sp. GC_Shp_3]|uniref:L,D-transpeptidase family protein n=1 Tax=Sphingomonas sp. GC_Shp_3 TaxID=2937383 RepID=UPI00226A9DB9|nr:L,D-transpeptidase family protein [Sphingomonas sp. GC_Shp_3]